MGERKVSNKYYPPDYDPEKIPPPKKQPKHQQMKVRNMLPMSIRCKTCGEYIYKGRKFNSRKEDVVGETYLGIRIFRFYSKCTNCSAEITIKTDPRNSDYTVESGASRNFEPWRAEDEVLEAKNKRRSDEEMGDAIKSLENKTLDSKRLMDSFAALDELKFLNSRHASLSTDVILETLQRSNEEKERKLEEEDEALIKSVQRLREAVIWPRIDDEDIDDDEDDDFFSTGSWKKRKVSEENPTDILTKDGVDSFTNLNGKLIFKSSSVRVSVVKKSGADSNGNKPRKENPQYAAAKEDIDAKPTDVTVAGLHSLCQLYGSDEDD